MGDLLVVEEEGSTQGREIPALFSVTDTRQEGGSS